MRFGSDRHGHERSEHRELKRRVADIALAAGADAVRLEFRGCDVVAMKRTDGREIVIGFEVERSNRNVARNITRDRSALRCDALVVVAESEKLRASILVQLKKRAPDCLTGSLLVIAAGELSEIWLRRLFGACLGSGCWGNKGCKNEPI